MPIKVLLIFVYVVYDCFQATLTELKSCDIDHAGQNNLEYLLSDTWEKKVDQSLFYVNEVWFIYLTIEKHLGSFHFGDIGNSAAMNILTHFLCENMCVSITYIICFYHESM